MSWTEMKCGYHNTYPFEEVPMGLSAKEILTEVNKAGGVAIAAHPCRNIRPMN